MKTEYSSITIAPKIKLRYVNFINSYMAAHVDKYAMHSHFVTYDPNRNDLSLFGTNPYLTH